MRVLPAHPAACAVTGLLGDSGLLGADPAAPCTLVMLDLAPLSLLGDREIADPVPARATVPFAPIP